MSNRRRNHQIDINSTSIDESFLTIVNDRQMSDYTMFYYIIIIMFYYIIISIIFFALVKTTWLLSKHGILPYDRKMHFYKITYRKSTLIYTDLFIRIHYS